MTHNSKQTNDDYFLVIMVMMVTVLYSWLIVSQQLFSDIWHWSIFSPLLSDTVMKSIRRQQTGCLLTQSSVLKWPSSVVQALAVWLTCWVTRLCSHIRIFHVFPSALVSSLWQIAFYMKHIISIWEIHKQLFTLYVCMCAVQCRAMLVSWCLGGYRAVSVSACRGDSTSTRDTTYTQ